MSRPEHTAPPEIFYNDDEAAKYTQNSRIIDIQSRLTYRALELLALPEGKPAFLLDVGCGSGLSGEVLEEEGHVWVGVDIAPAMLDIAAAREVEGDLFLHDIGHGFGYRPGTFDGAISISVIQWLCNADKKCNNPYKRLTRFFSTLYTALSRGARAVFQFYPENDTQVQMITAAALKAGFQGGIVVDYPNSAKARKTYLCLFAGQRDGQTQALPQGLSGEEGLGGEQDSVAYEGRRVDDRQRVRKGNRKAIKDKDWILNKKEQMRKKGDKKVANDSKYTGRKRKPKF
ncbi:williams-Beuren syndrome critical region protein 22 [Catenaria anguillulae PL171]|uniref:Williams-Beuren syndrome critical region protein 22 n=1 Tax=Catenaria anguillulae PL171 TaxID=765915 RepID=A0A1Y2HUZ5_9FUNG|nr:williams-Beuren syndrome critical region protein 22 [Catenaria anguillulae PL171]